MFLHLSTIFANVNFYNNKISDHWKIFAFLVFVPWELVGQVALKDLLVPHNFTFFLDKRMIFLSFFFLFLNSGIVPPLNHGFGWRSFVKFEIVTISYCHKTLAAPS